jgi:hypothetical protein
MSDQWVMNVPQVVWSGESGDQWVVNYIHDLTVQVSGGDGAVESVNNKTGVVVLDAADVGADTASSRDAAIAAAVASWGESGLYLDHGATSWSALSDIEGLKLLPEAIVHQASGDAAQDVEGWPYYPDGNAGGFLVGADGQLRHYQPGTGVCAVRDGVKQEPHVAVTTVVDGDVFAAPRRTIVMEGWDAEDPELTWIGGGPILDLGDGVGFMIVHEERDDDNGLSGSNWIYWTLSGAKVVDDGTDITVTWLGPIVSHQVTLDAVRDGGLHAGIGSGEFIVWRDQMYIHHDDHPTGEDADGITTWSRCPVADIAAAVAADEVPVFHKWHGEALDEEWTEPSLGGVSSTNDALQVIHMDDFVALPDDRILTVAAIEWFGAYGIGAAVGDDPLTWHGTGNDWPNTMWPIVEIGAQEGHSYPYLTLWSGTDRAKEVTSPLGVFAYWLDVPDPDGSWFDHTLVGSWLLPIPVPPDPLTPPPSLSPPTFGFITGDQDLPDEWGHYLVGAPSTIGLRSFTEDGLPGYVWGFTAGAQVTFTPADGAFINGATDPLVVPSNSTVWCYPIWAGLPIWIITQTLASSVRYDNSTSGLDSTKVQAALDELAARPSGLGQPSGGVAFAVAVHDMLIPGLPVVAADTQAVSADEIWWLPIVPTADCQVDSMVARIQTGSGAAAAGRLYLYSTVSGLPASLLVQGSTSLDLTNTGSDQESTFAAVNLKGGTLYWLGIHFSAACTMRATNISLAGPGGGAGFPTCLKTTGATYASGPPSNPTVTAAVNTKAPRIYARVV